MAHIVLDKKKVFDEYGEDIINYFKQFGISEKKFDIAKVCEELEADRIALDAVIQAYMVKGEEKGIFEIVSSAIFLLIRYHLWITVVETQITQLDDEYYMWLMRSLHIRKYISKYYKWGVPFYIIELLDYLEGTLEVAALVASEVLKDNDTKK